METHLNKYSNEQAYNSDLDKLIAPNVSLIDSTDEVKYLGTSDETEVAPSTPQPEEESAQLWETFEIIDIDGQPTSEYVLIYDSEYVNPPYPQYNIYCLDKDGTVNGKIDFNITYKVITKNYDNNEILQNFVELVNKTPKNDPDYPISSNPLTIVYPIEDASINKQQDKTIVDIKLGHKYNSPISNDTSPVFIPGLLADNRNANSFDSVIICNAYFAKKQ